MVMYRCIVFCKILMHKMYNGNKWVSGASETEMNHPRFVGGKMP